MIGKIQWKGMCSLPLPQRIQDQKLAKSVLLESANLHQIFPKAVQENLAIVHRRSPAKKEAMARKYDQEVLGIGTDQPTPSPKAYTNQDLRAHWLHAHPTISAEIVGIFPAWVANLDQTSGTPLLHRALEKGYGAMARLLRRYGANDQKQDYRGKTAKAIKHE